MKRTLALAGIALFVSLASTTLLAQESPFVGTWKLDVAKSRFTDGQVPKGETRTVTAEGNGLKVSLEGVAADGGRIAWTVTSNLDGKPAPVTGSGVPSGADMLAIKALNANTLTTTYLKAGKEVRTSRTVVSKDGKVTTVTSKGTDASGKPFNNVTVWEKQ